MFGKKTFIIAEIGNNHEGNFKVAKELIYHASRAGVDAVKFQTFNVNEFLYKNHEKFEFYKNFELTRQEFYDLYLYSKKKKLAFISTPLDIPSVKFLSKFSDCLKIASADIDYFPLVEAVKKTKKPTIISTGMSDLKRIYEAYKYFSHLNEKKFAIMHCVSSYPAEKKELNLNSIKTLIKKFKATIGYSDHTLPDEGMTSLVTSYLLGALILEKHFTFDKTLPGNDHYHAMDVYDLSRFKKILKNVNDLLGGDEFKRPIESEKISRQNARRSIVLKKELTAGHVLSEIDLTYKRPGTGISPFHWDEILGRKIAKNLETDHVLQWQDLID